MAAEQRKALEQLMGASLTTGPGGIDQRPPQVEITDQKVCRSYLCGACPHDLFTNTKGDIGHCPKVHQPNLKDEYMAASDDQKKQWNFEWDYKNDIARFITDCNYKINEAQRRLEKTADEIRQTNELLKAIHGLEEDVKWGVREIEMMGESGAVGLAVMEYHKLKSVRIEKEDKERELKTLSDTSGPSGHQKLQVCEVCGAYLSRLDNDRRLADHFYGKMHLGFAQMRKELERLQKELKTRPPPGRTEEPDTRAGGFGGRNRAGGYGRGGRGHGGHGPRW